MSVSIANGVATFTGTGPLTDATARLGGATSVIIKGYSSIGQNAFQDAAGLKSVTIPSSVNYIGLSAFSGTGLTSLLIPASVTRLDQAFLWNTNNLATIRFEPNSLITTIGHRVFMNAKALTSIRIPSGVTMIDSEAFSSTSRLTSITIPSSVTSIGSTAFIQSALTTATFPTSSSFAALGLTITDSPQSFFGTTGVTVVVSSDTKIFSGTGSLTNATSQLNGATNVIIQGYSTISSYAFNDAQEITSVSIPSSVTSIEVNAFIYTSNMLSFIVDSNNNNYSSDSSGVLFNKNKTSIVLYPIGNSRTAYTIPNTVTRVENYAFFNSNKLQSLTMPVGLVSIGANTFESLPNLTSVAIPYTVTSIGSNAFLRSGVTSATFAVSTYFSTFDLTITNSPQSFFGKSNVVVTTLDTKVFNGSSNELTSATSQLNGATNVVISGYTSIGAGAFLNATSLTSITIPSGVTSIGASAFQDSGLTTAFFESASTVNALSLPSGDLTNGYTVSSFYGKSSVTIRYTAALVAKAAAPAAVISDSTFTSLFTEIGVNISNITSEILPNTNDPYVEYTTKLTIPNVDLSTLSYTNKANIINTVKSLYAAKLGFNVNKIIVTLVSGSIILNILKDGITESMLPICFPKGTPVTTNQGVIAIEKLNPDIHTIRGKKIVAITQSRPLHKYIISIETDALGKNVPSAPIQISKEHKVFYKGKMVKANELVDVCEGVTRIPYNGETLYNVLMEKHDNMMINNVICETLDPKNIMAKICGGKYNRVEQANICKELNDIIKTDNVPAYKKLYASLK